MFDALAVAEVDESLERCFFGFKVSLMFIARDSEGRQYRANCGRCSGAGRVTCGTCDGSGRLVWYKVVVTTFKTIFDDYIFMVFVMTRKLFSLQIAKT